MTDNAPPPDNFDPKDFVKFKDSHTKDIEDLSKRITCLEGKYGTNEQLALTICAAVDSQKNIDVVLKKNIELLVKSDKGVRDFLKEIMREVDKEDWLSFRRKIGAPIWTILLLIIGAFLEWVSHKFG